MSAARRARLTADRVTFADCMALDLEVTVLCSRCAAWRGVHPENGVPEKLWRKPIADLMTEGRLKCSAPACAGRLADAIHVTFPGNAFEERREILRLHRN